MQTITVYTRLRKCLITKCHGTSQTQSVRYVRLHTFAHPNLVDTVTFVNRLVHFLVHAGLADDDTMPIERRSTLDTTLRFQLQESGKLVNDRRTYQRILHIRWSGGHNGVVPYGIIDYAYLVNVYGISHTEFVLHRSIVMDTRVYIHYCCRYQ